MKRSSIQRRLALLAALMLAAGVLIRQSYATYRAGSSLELVGRTENALLRIDGGSREVAGNVRNISDALAEQDAAIRLIAADVEKIARMTESNSDVAVSNSRTASELDGLSRELREAVSRFCV
ncbi:MAG: hypothetical protein HY777_04765 [Betaproteobacteria bacterium]|nr:hypothetical protein [Betaproteobacteria bacterium]